VRALFVLASCMAGGCEHAASAVDPDTLTTLSPASTLDAGASDDDAGAVATPVHALPVVEIPPPRVSLADGDLQGRFANHVRSFLGIPYAKPPLGARRFRAPEPNDAWHSLLPATQFGPRCAQVAASTLQSAASDNEDCLYLNVWTPEHAEQLPVLVFIHGGDHESGSSAEPVRYTGAGSLYSGQGLAEKGSVVVVTLNYRLGVFGFLAHAELSQEGSKSGNQGLWDQQFALRWVQRNIAAFGGDASRVTIVGEGSGASDVCLHVASPQSRGLFWGAISQSGGCTTHQTTRAVALQRARGWVTQLGCSGESELACLRAKAPRELLAAAPSNAFAAAAFGPIVDGDFLPRQPRELFDLGQVAAVPYLLGSNSDEGSLLALGQPEILGESELIAALTRTFTTSPAQIMQRYPMRGFSAAALPFNAAYLRILGDARVVCATSDTALRAAKLGAAVYAYNFALPFSDGVDLGAAQGAELPYVFGSGAPEFNQVAQGVSDRLQAYWIAFATSGDPNTASKQLNWPAYREDRDVRINFARTATLLQGFRAEPCALWGSNYNLDFASAQ
jgi:para-nitrobenzyl esterase